MTRITNKTISMIENFWDNATVADRILALRGIDVVGKAAERLASVMFIDLPEDICANIIRGSK